MSGPDEVPIDVVEEVLDDMGTDTEYLKQFLAERERDGKRWILRDQTVDQLETARSILRNELQKIEQFLDHLPPGGDKTYAVKRRRIHESRLFDVEDLLERLESYTFDQD